MVLYNPDMLSEFDLIERFFTRPVRDSERVPLGIGDDCALLAPTPGTRLAISSDMLVEGRHFFPGADPFSLGHKCLAVNLSDLAAMGARPLAFTLALALPRADETWLAPFSRGMLALADRYQCELIGGDTTKGPLTICITVFGESATGQTLCRDQARVDDDIWVSGSLGDARLALAAYRNEVELDETERDRAAERMHAPAPRVHLGLALRGIARAAIDVSDGLIGDLGHILKQSRVGAMVDVDTLPFGQILARQASDLRRGFALAGGDDYELCFTAAPERRAEVLAASESAATPVTRIGRIVSSPGLQLTDANGKKLDLHLHSFDHFTTQ